MIFFFDALSIFIVSDMIVIKVKYNRVYLIYLFRCFLDDLFGIEYLHQFDGIGKYRFHSRKLREQGDAYGTETGGMGCGSRCAGDDPEAVVRDGLADVLHLGSACYPVEFDEYVLADDAADEL